MPQIKETVAFHDDGFVIAREQKVSDIVDHCKARHNEGFHGDKDFKFVGMIPELVVEDYCTKQGIPFSEFFRNPEHTKRLMNDPAYSDLRVWKGIL